MQQLGCQRACGKEGVRGASAKNDGGRAWAMRGPAPPRTSSCSSQPRPPCKLFNGGDLGGAALLVLVDAEDAHAVHAGELGHEQHRDHRDVDAQRLPAVVGAVAGQQEEHRGDDHQEFSGGGELLAIVYLLPERLAGGKGGARGGVCE